MIDESTSHGRTKIMQKLAAAFLALALTATSFGQGSAPEPAKPAAKEKLRNEAVEFLRETMVEVGTMRSVENRLSFSAEMAALMWFHDEKEAKAIFNSVTADFQRLLFDIDRQLNALAAEAEALEAEGRDPMISMPDIASKIGIERKLNKALEMRQQIAMSAAEHDPDLAMAFFTSSIAAITNKEFRDRAAERDSSFEIQLMTQIAQTNAAKAAKFAVKSLDKGFNNAHLELLKKLYEKDAEKGIEFASAVVSHFKTNKLDKDGDPWVLQALVFYGDETDPKPPNTAKKKPVLTVAERRELTEVLAASMLENDEHGQAMSFMGLFEKYTPTRAGQIRAKNRSGSAYAAANALNTAANAAMTVANLAAMAANTDGSSNADRRQKAIEARLESERKLMEEVASIGTKKLPKEERDKIVVQARKLISGYGGKEQRIGSLSALAAQVATAGDKELALEIMKDAEGLVATQPKNYQEFMHKWILISGYSEVDPAHAFPMLTDTIFRLNTTIDAFAKAAEFLDISGEMIDDGEVQVGQFGGSMLRGLTSDLKMVEPTVRTLAKADFSKIKAATNTFDRTEVRILAKMLVLRTVLSDPEKAKDPDKPDPNIGLVLN